MTTHAEKKKKNPNEKQKTCLGAAVIVALLFLETKSASEAQELLPMWRQKNK